MYDSTLNPLSGTALFTPVDFAAVNQLADLLFDNTQHTIFLKSEHEAVTRAWILSALKNSHLAQKIAHLPMVYQALDATLSVALPQNAWLYTEPGQLTRHHNTVRATAITLCLPRLSFEQRARVLHQLCIDKLQTHLLTIPLQTIYKALEWQSRYCADQHLLNATILLLHRAANRFLLTHADDEQTTLLESQHVAEILVDWQQVNLSDLLRPSDESIELKLFLSEHIIGQKLALEQFIQTKTQSNVFILAGVPYSGKQTFVEYYAQYLCGAKGFCITFDLSFFTNDSPWSTILLPTPHYQQTQSRLSLLEIVTRYPQAVILLKNSHENPLLLERLQQVIKKSFFQIKNQCISIDTITWMLLLDIVEVETMPPTTEPAPLFIANTSSELCNILYRPDIKISPDFNHEDDTLAQRGAIAAAKKQLPTTLFDMARILPFVPITEKDKKQIINKEVKRIIHQLRKMYNITVYYQEEVIQFLLQQVQQANKGFTALHKNLYHKIEHIFLKALKQGAMTEGQVMMLQLNDSGHVLQIVRTAARSTSTPAKLKV